MNDRASVRITETLHNKIANSIMLLKRRHVAAHQWPLESDDASLLSLSRSCMPENVAAALALLENDDIIMKANIIEVSRNTALYVDDIKICINFTIPFAAISYYTRNEAYATIENDHPKYEDIREWATKATKIRDDAEYAYRSAREILGCVSTTGQLKRVWPDLLPLLPNEIQASLNTAQRASRISDHIKSVVEDIDIARCTQTMALLAMLDTDYSRKVHV